MDHLPAVITAVNPSVISVPATNVLPFGGVPQNDLIMKLNRKLRDAYDSDQLLDFHSISLNDKGDVDENLYNDRIHLNTAGQKARAAAAFEFLIGEDFRHR